MIVKSSVVTTLVDVSLGGGGGGSATPGECICPASADAASTKLRVIAAHIWRSVFIWLPPRVMQDFERVTTILHQPSRVQLFLQEREGVRKICTQYLPETFVLT